MKNVIFVHGMPSRWEFYLIGAAGLRYSSLHWAGWLRRELERRDYVFNAPEMPRAYDPQWDVWAKKVEQFEMCPDTTLIGHSCGAGFWIKYLSLHKDLKVGKVILVAPWLDPDNNQTHGFFADYKIDPHLTKRAKKIIIFNSDNDMGNVFKSVAQVRKVVKDVQYREFHKYGHFTILDMKTRRFPELLNEVLQGKT